MPQKPKKPTLGKARRVPPSTCPHCAVTLDAASAMGSNKQPKPGAATLCVACGEWSVFGKGLRLRKPTDDELFEIGMQPEARLAREAWVRVTQKMEQKNGSR